MNNNEILDHNGNEIAIEAFHPGEFLQKEIEERQLPKKDVAKALDIHPNHLSEIFAGKRNISARLAVKPGKVLGINPQYWFSLKLAYGLYIAMQEEAGVLANTISFLEYPLQRLRPIHPFAHLESAHPHILHSSGLPDFPAFGLPHKTTIFADYFIA